jgi:hypothetical protein
MPPVLNQAGIYSKSDYDALVASYEVARLAYNSHTRAPLNIRDRETIGNTTRYIQQPGTSTIHGGRVGDIKRA